MKNVTIARNYAQALFAAAEAKGKAPLFGGLIDAVAGAVAADERIAVVLESPRVAKGVKAQILERALRGGGRRRSSSCAFSRPWCGAGGRGSWARSRRSTWCSWT